MKLAFIRPLLGAVVLTLVVSAATPARATQSDDLAAPVAPSPYVNGDDPSPVADGYEDAEDETYSPFDEQLLANAEAADETPDPTGDEGTTPQLIDHADDLWAGAQEVARRVRQIAMLLAAGLIATGVMIMMFGGIGGGDGPQPARIIAFAMMGVIGILVWPEVMTKTKELCDATARYIDTFQFDHEQSGIASATVRTFEDMGKGIGVSLEKPFWWQLMVAPYTQGLVYLAWFLAVFFYVLYRFVWQVGWLFLYIVGPFGMAAAATGTPTGIRIAKGLYMSVLNLACWPIAISILFALLNLGIHDYSQDPSSIGGKQVMVALVVALMIPVTLAFTKQFLSGGGLDTNLAAFTSQMLTMAMLGALKMVGTAIAAVPAIAGAGVALGASAGAALKGMSALGSLASVASSADEGGSGATALSGRVAPMPANDGTARAAAGAGGASATPGVGAALLGVGRAVGGAVGSVVATGAETIGNMALAAAEAGAKESGHVATRYGVSDIFGSRSGGRASGRRSGARALSGAAGGATAGGDGGDGPPPGGDHTAGGGPDGGDGRDDGPAPRLASANVSGSNGPRTSAGGDASTAPVGSATGPRVPATERASAPVRSGEGGSTTTTRDDGGNSTTGSFGSSAPAPTTTQPRGGATRAPASAPDAALGDDGGIGEPPTGSSGGGAGRESAPAPRSANLTGGPRIPTLQDLGLGGAFGPAGDSPADTPAAPSVASQSRTTFGARGSEAGDAAAFGGDDGEAGGSAGGGSVRVSTIDVGRGAGTPQRTSSAAGGAGRSDRAGGAHDGDPGSSVISDSGGEGSSFGAGSPPIGATAGGRSRRASSSVPASDDVVEIVEVDDKGADDEGDGGGGSFGSAAASGDRGDVAAPPSDRTSTRTRTINRLISNAAARVNRRERPRVDPADEANGVRPPDSAY